MVNTSLLLIQLLNGLALGALYLLVAVGLTVIFGVTKVVNFAHGALYMLGAYIGFFVVQYAGNFWLALLVAPIVVGVVGAAIERLTLHRIYGDDLIYHIMITFGISLVITSLIEIFWGLNPKRIAPPEIVAGGMQLGPIFYPRYKLFIIVASLLVALVIILLLKFTKAGLIVRAGAQNQQMTRILGINISNYFTLIFGFASGLAAIAGVLAAPFLSVNPGMGNQIIIIAFVIVILGGLGSFRGSVVAAFVIGVGQTLGETFVPELTGFSVFLLMVVVLLVRPQGVFGEYEIRTDEAKIKFKETIKPIAPTDRRLLGVIVVLALVPLGTGVLFSSYYLGLLALMLIWAIFALSLDIVMGYLGLLSLGHAAFYGVGGYALGLFTIHVTNSFLAALVVAIVLAAVLAWVVGAFSVRLTSIYFALITLAVAEILNRASRSFDSLTGGANGLADMPNTLFLGINLTNNVAVFYLLTLVFMYGIYVGSVKLLESPFGLSVKGIRESERRMKSLGYDTTKYKRRVMVISGMISGLAGALFATYQAFISPSSLHWIVSGDVLIAMVFGGIGTLFGPMIGGGVYIALKFIISSYFDQWRLIFGLLLVLLVLFAPRGLISLPRATSNGIEILRDRLDRRNGVEGGDDVNP